MKVILTVYKVIFNVITISAKMYNRIKTIYMATLSPRAIYVTIQAGYNVAATFMHVNHT